MAKVQCPHCKVINDGVGLDEPCKHCGTVLGAPISALNSGDAPPSSENNGANKADAPGGAPGTIEPDSLATADAASEGGEARY